jgi:hypothetical protein
MRTEGMLCSLVTLALVSTGACAHSDLANNAGGLDGGDLHDDAGHGDAGSSDAGPRDAGSPDANSPDAGTDDASRMDANNGAEAGAPDADSESQPASGGWPGQSGDPVGHTYAPGYPGSLTAWTGGDVTVGGTAGNPKVYSFIDFDSGTSGVSIVASHVTFVGCRFQSNSVDNANITIDGPSEITFSYCSIVPRVALAPTIPGAAWPSAGAGMQLAPEDLASQPNPGLAAIMIPHGSGYQYGINIFSGGPVTVDHCDIWGWANAIPLYSTTAQMMITDTWIHDNRYPGQQPNDDHGDGIGYLNGGVPPQNVTITHCTITAEANTNAIAFQAATSPYGNIVVRNNYFTGFDYTAMMGDNSVASTGMIFEDNVFGTDIPWAFGPVFPGIAGTFRAAGCSWQRNKLKVLPGTGPTVNQDVQWTSADDGKFVWADGTYNATDFH